MSNVPHGIGSLINLVSLDLSTPVEIYELPGIGYTFGAEFGDIGQLAVPNFTSLLANLGSLKELRLGSVDLSQSVEWCDALSLYTPNLRVLSLPFCQVPSPICRALSSLCFLSEIDLQFNHLTGVVPDFFANYSFISALQLSYNQLEGWVPPEIFEHKKIVTIDIFFNPELSGSLPNISADNCLQNLLVGRTNFSGTIPSSIGKIKSLKRLGLDAPNFAGNLPSSIGELRSLNTLRVSGLNLVGPIPSWITNLTSLEVLQFSQCGLYGLIPSSIGHLIKLKTFAIIQSKASGEIPPQIFNMTQLEKLALGSNNFTGTAELNSLRRLPYLNFLDLSNIKIVDLEGHHNSSMVSFPNIAYLLLASCSMTKFPSILKHLNDLHGIDLSNNNMHGAIPSWVWGKWSTTVDFCPNFFFLNLSHNNFTSVSYESFLPLCPIEMDLSFNMFEGPIPLPQFSAQVLDYSSNMFSSLPHNFSTQLEDTLMEDAYPLRVMNLKENQLDGELPDNVNENCALELLDISGNRIEGQLPRSLVACKRLEVLAVANNKITDFFPCWMSTLPILQVLILKHNKFFGSRNNLSGSISTSFCSPTLQVLDLSYNNLSGPLPSCMMEDANELQVLSLKNNQLRGELPHNINERAQVYQFETVLTYKGSDLTIEKVLKTLVFLDVSNNAFQGSIPATIGELVLLRELNMSHNSFIGPIPPQLDRLNILESMDLSSNELSGEIPQGLASLNFLTTLNLSDNKLVGSIPESPQFSTFSNNSFLGNDGLCGPPLSKECINTTPPNMVIHDSKKSSKDIMLFLFVGLGYGVGFAVAIVVAWGIPIRKRSTRH
ncbi:hypothetical protein HU200_055603 [Digitaria exilis]|uniref:Uncharacterized protein n=1 Tax=Digitaria exilis TaxID=1010633 RepID=A0A835AIC0_9POAL|nr:hypothetical protein HU200_055603 [Digitaria exilis]